KLWAQAIRERDGNRCQYAGRVPERRQPGPRFAGGPERRSGRARKNSSIMNTKDFIRLGIPLGQATRRATDFISKFILAGGDKTRLEEEVKAIIANPPAFPEDN